MDEQWSVVGHKDNPRWLWYAVDHATNTVLAYVFGRRQDTVFNQLRALLKPFAIRHYYTDDWGAYQRHLDSAQHSIGKRNTQKTVFVHYQRLTEVAAPLGVGYMTVSSWRDKYREEGWRCCTTSHARVVRLRLTVTNGSR